MALLTANQGRVHHLTSRAAPSTCHLERYSLLSTKVYTTGAVAACTAQPVLSAPHPPPPLLSPSPSPAPPAPEKYCYRHRSLTLSMLAKRYPTSCMSCIDKLAWETQQNHALQSRGQHCYICVGSLRRPPPWTFCQQICLQALPCRTAFTTDAVIL